MFLEDFMHSQTQKLETKKLEKFLGPTSLQGRARIFCKAKISTLVADPVFNNSMLLLTFYMLFGPDLVALYGNADHDAIFVVINTFVFFMFLAEVILMLIGRPDYVFVPMILDVVSLLSVLGETWFLQGGLVAGSVQDRMAVARSSKMTRFTRIVRIARVTRLVPHMMKLIGRGSFNIARHGILRKMERVCVFLDIDRDGLLSKFDLKAFYLVLLEEMRRIRGINCRALLIKDMAALNDKPEEELKSTMNYETFCNTFLQMEAGKKLLQLFNLDVQQDEGSYQLTSRICENVAMKICIGLVVTAIMMQAMSSGIKDDSAETLLYLLTTSARYENDRGSQANFADLCHQVATAPLKFMFLYLENKLYVDGGACVPEGIPLDKDPVDRLSDIIESKSLRSTQVLQVCWPPAEACDVGKARSVAMLDIEDEARDTAMWALLQTTCLIVLLLLFVVGFNHVIMAWSKLMLLPLRKLVDDMSTMQSLELVQLDAEHCLCQKSGDGRRSATSTFAVRLEQQVKQPQVMDELLNLQKAYEHMKHSLQAWSMYVPPAVVQCLLDAGQEAKMAIQRVHVTVLFCDIANFDELTHISADEVLSVLAMVLGGIADVIDGNHGTFLEFIGDEVMAVFNAPAALREHSTAALKSALEIHEVIETLPPVRVGDSCEEVAVKCKVGVHTAKVLAGNLGSVNRIKYGLLGDGVNLSARLKGLNSKYGTQTLTTDAVTKPLLERSDNRFITRPIDLVAVKGKTEPTKIHELLSPESCKDKSETSKYAALHTQAFRFYHKRLFSEALAIFQEVSDAFEQAGRTKHDEPSRLLASRCRKYIATPPPPEWDGVERLKAKLFVVEDEPKPETAQEAAANAPPPAEAVESQPTEAASSEAAANSPALAPATSDPSIEAVEVAAVDVSKDEMERLESGGTEFTVLDSGPEATLAERSPTTLEAPPAQAVSDEVLKAASLPGAIEGEQ
jgi:class 3 adenylate cyclase